MPYTALPDRRIPYDNDGTMVGYGYLGGGIIGWHSSANNITSNDFDFGTGAGLWNSSRSDPYWWLFFPETREVSAVHQWGNGVGGVTSLKVVAGTNDTTNGLDGTWETASLAGGYPSYLDVYSWRAGIKAVSLTGPKRTVRIGAYETNNGIATLHMLHLYGEKGAGQTPDDIIYIDHDTTPGVEYTTPEDFGDQPLGTTVVRQFRVKNTSASKTANTINIQCNDSDFAISTDGVVWVVTINIASLAAGVESSTMYVRCTTPAAGDLLGPRFARIVTTVASYT